MQKIHYFRIVVKELNLKFFDKNVIEKLNFNAFWKSLLEPSEITSFDTTFFQFRGERSMFSPHAAPMHTNTKLYFFKFLKRSESFASIFAFSIEKLTNFCKPSGLERSHSPICLQIPRKLASAGQYFLKKYFGWL